MHRAVLLIGGNQGDRHSLLLQATDLIRQRIGSVALLSSIHETEPWGEFEIENSKLKIENFLNQALVVDTPLAPHDVLHEALAIEKELGRQRKLSTLHSPLSTFHSPLSTFHSPLSTLHSPLSTFHSPLSTRKYTSRPIDIDLIFYDSLIIDTPDLTVPHPRMHLRRFVLEPLCEVMPEYEHPLLHKTMKQLLSEL